MDQESASDVAGRPIDTGEPVGDAAKPPPRRRRRLLRAGMWSLAAILVLALAAALTGVWEVRRAFPQYDGVLKVAGLSHQVTVYRDSHAIPQLYAGDADDLFIAQGYVASQERFYQMDFDRHITSGTLSEMFGGGQLATDEYLRTMDWRGVAQREWSVISPSSRRYLTDFAKGVNDYLAQHPKGAVSLEYTVLGLTNHGYRIAPWSPIDSLAWLKALAWDLVGNMNDEITRATLLAGGLSRTQVDSLYPGYPYGENAPIVAGGGAVRDGRFVAGTAPSGPTTTAVTIPGPGTTTTTGATPVPAAALPALRAVRAAVDQLPPVVGLNPPGIGSNSWVVSGRLTTTGKPILANDPHLAPSMPSIWYQMGLHCTCAFNVEGYTFPDTPGVVIGHNDQIAWGFTNLDPDVTDLYLEKVRGDDYEVDGRWVPLSIRTTTVKVAGGKPVTLTIRTTDNGPLLSDVSGDLKAIAKTGTASAPTGGVTYAVALKWTALQPGTTMDALFAVDQAGDWSQFRTAAARFDVPAQNMVYADVHGNIGYQSPGLIPIRGKGDGRWPAPGWDSAYDWTGYIPFDQLPSQENPPDGYFATANQAVINPDTYQPFLTGDWSYGYRSQRIADMIRAASSGGRKISVADVRQMQLDTRNDFAAQIVPTLRAENVTGTARRAQALLAGWDFRQPAGGAAGTRAAKDSAAAAYFNEFWHDLVALTFDELPAADRPDGRDRWFVVVDGLVKDPDNAWWDNRSTPKVETRDDIVVEAMDQASEQLSRAQGGDPSGWRWGELNRLTIQNQSLGTSGIGPIEWLFNYGPVGVPGGCDVVVATCSNLSASLGDVGSLPSMRMVVDLSDLDNSRWVQLVGESGHAFSDHYHDQFDLWLDGRTLPMPWSRAAVRAATRDTLTLTGAGARP